jgi:hypothetical protein
MENFLTILKNFRTFDENNINKRKEEEHKMSTSIEKFMYDFSKYVNENFHADKALIFKAINEYCVDMDIEYEIDVEEFEDDFDDIEAELDDVLDEELEERFYQDFEEDSDE